MASKFNINDYNIYKRTRINPSYSVSLYLDSFNMDEGWGQLNDGTNTSYSVSSFSHKVSNNHLLNKRLRKINDQ